MQLTDKQKLRQDLAINTIFSSMFGASVSLDGTLTSLLIDQMMIDSDIKSAIESIKSKVLGLNLRIISKSDTDVGEINNRYKDLDLYDVTKRIIDSRFTGYNVQELVYDDSYNVVDIKLKPREWFYTEYKQEINDYVWIYSQLGIGASGGEVPTGKALISVNDESEQYPMGRSELESIVKYYKIKNNALTYADQIVQKYGGIITWFIYNEGTSTEELQEMVDGVANLQDGSVMPIPAKPGNVQQGLNKEFGFIKTSDLTSDIHSNMINFCKQQISEYMLGNSLTQRTGDVGSYAAANVANDVRKDIIDMYIAYCVKNLNWLLYYDGMIKGYDYRDLTFEFYEDDDTIFVEDIKGRKLENYRKLYEIGYELDPEYISEELKIPIEYLIKRDMTQNSLPFQFEKKEPVFKKKINFRNRIKKNWKQVDDKFPDIAKEMSDIIRKQVKGIKNEYDLANLDIKKATEKLSELLTIVRMKGIYDVFEETNSKIEFEDIQFKSVYDMPFQEAVSYLTEKFPRFVDLLDRIQNDIDNQLIEINGRTSDYVISKLQQSLTKVIENGETFDDWKKNNVSFLEKAGISNDGYYLKSVFRTTLSTAYNAGRLEQQKANIDNQPYWLYDAVEDDRTSEICLALNGKVYRADDPIWDQIYPPNHPNCRSGVISLDKEEYKDAIEYGETFIKDSENDSDTQEALNLLSLGSFDTAPKV